MVIRYAFMLIFGLGFMLWSISRNETIFVSGLHLGSGLLLGFVLGPFIALGVGEALPWSYEDPGTVLSVRDLQKLKANENALGGGGGSYYQFNLQDDEDAKTYHSVSLGVSSVATIYGDYYGPAEDEALLEISRRQFDEGWYNWFALLAPSPKYTLHLAKK